LRLSPTGAIGDFATMRVSDDTVRAVDAKAATDGMGYALVWSVFESNRFGGPIASVWDGAAWPAPESLDSNIFNTWLSGIAANPATGAYAVAWEAWAGAADDALIASDGDTFTVFWRQADPAGHPAVQLPFVYDELP
jgi:hypothetical protein